VRSEVSSDHGTALQTKLQILPQSRANIKVRLIILLREISSIHSESYTNAPSVTTAESINVIVAEHKGLVVTGYRRE
jgi:hypothetical protein